jgi:citrate synthase
MARRLAEEACCAAGRPEWFALAQAVEEAVVAESDARANVDYYLTSIYLACGFPAAAFAPLFAVARTPGWIAHALEQGRDPELIRPRATYVGPLEERYKSTRARR